MSRSFTSVVSSRPLRFIITGGIDAWDPVTCGLRINHNQFWVAPGVSVMGLRAGAYLTALGYQEDLTGRRIITELTLDVPRTRIAQEVPW